MANLHRAAANLNETLEYPSLCLRTPVAIHASQQNDTKSTHMAPEINSLHSHKEPLTTNTSNQSNAVNIEINGKNLQDWDTIKLVLEIKCGRISNTRHLTTSNKLIW